MCGALRGEARHGQVEVDASWDLFKFSIFKLQHARREWRLSLRCEFGVFFPFPSLSEVVIIP